MSQFDDPYPAIPNDPYAVPDADVGIDLDYLAHLLKLCTAWLFGTTIAICIGLVIWRLRSPVTYERYFGVNARQARWMLWSLIAWPRIARDSGLSSSRNVTRKDMQGKQTTKKIWTHPEVLGVRMSGHCLRLRVRTRTGQTVDDLEKAVPAIRDAVGAHSGRSTVIAPGTVRMEFVMREQLSVVETANTPTRSDAATVEIGRRENGSAWLLRIAGLHTLTVGCSGAGKGSIFWGIACGLGPAVKSGTALLFAIDLKYGIEVSVGLPSSPGSQQPKPKPPSFSPSWKSCSTCAGELWPATHVLTHQAAQARSSYYSSMNWQASLPTSPTPH
ncbi:hypothetical protein TM48_04627 [Mycobacterium shottsii]|nr:hypothetical protein TM48_04627 [Mycobacterium shottsii]